MKFRIRETKEYTGKTIYIPEYESRKGWINIVSEYGLHPYTLSIEEAKKYIKRAKELLYEVPEGKIIYEES